MSDNVKFSYLKDPSRPERVITVARKIDKQAKLVRFAIAVCRPKGYWVDSTNKIGGALNVKVSALRDDGDEFSKEIGRTISTGRLYARGVELPLEEDEPPMVTISEYMASRPVSRGKGEFIRRTFDSYLDKVEEYKAQQ